MKVAETQEAAKGDMSFRAESRLQTVDASGSNKQVVAVNADLGWEMFHRLMGSNGCVFLSRRPVATLPLGALG